MVFVTSAGFLLAGLWLGQAFDLWAPFVEDGFSACLPQTTCPRVDQTHPVKAELLTFGLLSLGGIAASVLVLLLLLRKPPGG